MIEATPGGRFYTKMVIPEMGEMAGEGCVLLADPHRRLVTSNTMLSGFRPAPPMTGEHDFAFTTDLRLTDENGGTRYIATAMHSLPAHKNTHEKMGFHDGWGTAAKQLETLAATL